MGAALVAALLLVFAGQMGVIGAKRHAKALVPRPRVQELALKCEEPRYSRPRRFEVVCQKSADGRWELAYDKDPLEELLDMNQTEVRQR